MTNGSQFLMILDSVPVTSHQNQNSPKGNFNKSITNLTGSKLFQEDMKH